MEKLNHAWQQALIKTDGRKLGAALLIAVATVLWPLAKIWELHSWDWEERELATARRHKRLLEKHGE